MSQNQEATHKLIVAWVGNQARVLDLGCGDGQLLEVLARNQKVSGYGVEIDELMVAKCVARGVSVIQADIERGLDFFASDSFDVAILKQTLPEMINPAAALHEMLRVAQRAVVSFDNAGHWCQRLTYLRGRVPKFDARSQARQQRLITLEDFETMCLRQGLEICRRHCLASSRQVLFLPELTTEIAVYELKRSAAKA